MNYTKHFSVKQTQQTQSIPNRSDMVKNNDVGYVFQIDKWKMLERFLIIGSEGNTYYCTEQKMTVENAKNIIECIKEDGVRVVNTIVDISLKGKAPKNDSAIFVLALATTFGNSYTKKLAYNNISTICRIGTHIFTFCENIQHLRGWSSGLRKGVGKFYINRKAESLTLQLIKYQQRNGWTHTDVLRLCHCGTKNSTINNLLRWCVGKEKNPEDTLINAFEKLQNTTDKLKASQLIKEYKLPRECVPTTLLNSKEVWEALLIDMSMTALIRNLGKMSSIGLLDSNLSENVKYLVDRINNTLLIKKSRLHPIQILLALKTYSSGRGLKGNLRWYPVPKIIDSLDNAFYQSFSNVNPTHKNLLLGIDVSNSMTSNIEGFPLTSREVASALALVTSRVEDNVEILGYSDEIVPLKISNKMRMDDVCKLMNNMYYGNTYCALPMVYAKDKNLNVDTFVIYTDNETNTGDIHPCQALLQYRKSKNNQAKMVVVGMTSTGFSIADPLDMGMMDVVGFDTAMPSIITNFISDYNQSSVHTDVENFLSFWE